MTFARVLILILGVIVILLAVGLLFTGGTLIWLDQARTDDEGFIGTGTVQLDRGSRAIITPPIELSDDAMAVFRWIDLSTVRVVGRNNDEPKRIFMGIGEDPDVLAYLSDVNYDAITHVVTWGSVDVDYRNHPGNSVPPVPASQTFWLASASGPGTQTLDWEPEEGTFSIVLMNHDASSEVDFTVALKAKVDAPILAAGIGFVVGGMLLVAAGIIMIYLSSRKPGTTATPTML